MTFSTLKIAALAGLLAVGLAASTSAATAPTAPDAAETARAQLAAQMAAFGIENHDPYSLLAAVEAMQGVHAKIAMLDPANADHKRTYDPVTLLKAAKTYAVKDPNLTKVIDAKLAQAGTGQGWYDAYGNYHYTCYYYTYYGYVYYRCY